jgi:hypothetical protein
MKWFKILLHVLVDSFRSRKNLEAEVPCLRQQLSIFKANNRHLRLSSNDRRFWILMSIFFRNWKEAHVIVKPETVLRWQRSLSKMFWTWKSERKPGRPNIDQRLFDLIQQLARENPLLGAPQIHGILLGLGFKIVEQTVSRYMSKGRRPRPGGDWATFTRNQSRHIIAVDFFTVFTSTFKQLRGMIILAHDRRKIVHVGVTPCNNLLWLRNQMSSAFPGECSYRFLIRDNDAVFGGSFNEIMLQDFNLRVNSTSKGCPWQNAYVERAIGTIRRELLNHVIVWNESHLLTLLREYQNYYNESRGHDSLGKDTPISYGFSSTPPKKIVRIEILGGLHSIHSAA